MKIWAITASFEGGEKKRLTFKTEIAYRNAIASLCLPTTINEPRAISDDFTNTIIYYPDKLVLFFCAEVWASAEGDMAVTREIQLASDEFKKQIETRKALINSMGNG